MKKMLVKHLPWSNVCKKSPFILSRRTFSIHCFPLWPSTPNSTFTKILFDVSKTETVLQDCAFPLATQVFKDSSVLHPFSAIDTHLKSAGSLSSKLYASLYSCWLLLKVTPSIRSNSGSLSKLRNLLIAPTPKQYPRVTEGCVKRHWRKDSSTEGWFTLLHVTDMSSKGRTRDDLCAAAGIFANKSEFSAEILYSRQ